MAVRLASGDAEISVHVAVPGREQPVEAIEGDGEMAGSHDPMVADSAGTRRRDPLGNQLGSGYRSDLGTQHESS